MNEKIEIIIPTCRDRIDISALVGDVEGYSYPIKVNATCAKASAAENRNFGLELASDADIIIMIDDDTAGFYTGWVNDMISPLTSKENIAMVSARLIKPDGGLAPMMFSGNPSQPLSDVPRLPTACVAFWNNGERFNEKFIGSGFEDDDFCGRLKLKYPKHRFVINNQCKIIHINNELNQHGKYYEHNKKLFDSLWITSGIQGEHREPTPEYKKELGY